MSVFDNISTDSNVQSQGDVLYTGNYTSKTGIYKCLVELAYAHESRGGAKAITVHFRSADGEMTHRETFYYTNKKKQVFYEKDKKKVYLPGYEQMDNLAHICAGVPLTALKDEMRMVKLYDWEAKKEVPKEVPVFPELMGKPVRVGLLLKETNRRKKSGEKYVNTNEKRTFNEVSKLFHPNGLSVAEKAAGNTEAVFIKEWEETYPEDYVYSTYKEVAETAVTSAVEAASAAAAEASAVEDDDLFA